MNAKLWTFIGMGLALNLTLTAAEGELKTDKEKVSYSFGMQYGSFLKQNQVEIDLPTFNRAVTDTLAGKTLLNDAESREVMNKFRQEMMAKRQAREKEQSEKNKKAGADFLAANKAKDGVKTTASGLQYKVITEGKGAKPTNADTVKTHYRGTLIDGTEFDSSYSRGQPAKFPVTGVIKGWTEALQLMPVGSKWQLFIPSELAYGERGSPPKIEPGSTLVFEIELLEIDKPEQPKPVTSDIIKVPSAEELKKGAKIEVIKDVDAEIKKQKEAEKKDKPADPKKN